MTRMKREMQAGANALRQGLAELWRGWLRISRRSPRSLRLCESLALGESRFVAVVEFEESRFLLGSTPSCLVLLSRLPNSTGNAQGDPEKTNRFDTKRLEMEMKRAAEMGLGGASDLIASERQAKC